VAASIAFGTVRTPATIMFLIDISLAGLLLGRRAIGTVAGASIAKTLAQSPPEIERPSHEDRYVPLVEEGSGLEGGVAEVLSTP